MRSGGKPSASDATWVITVYVPVPRSWVPDATIALPSGRMRASAAASLRFAGYVALAMPRPISVLPSRIERGVAARRDQPKRCAPVS